jgi:mannose-6-phosphate isomerase-like protein (cupin superfamily)
LRFTFMSLQIGEDIGLEMHPDVDQFIRIEEEQGIVKMGDRRARLDFQRPVSADYVILTPKRQMAPSFQHGPAAS